MGQPTEGALIALAMKVGRLPGLRRGPLPRGPLSGRTQGPV